MKSYPTAEDIVNQEVSAIGKISDQGIYLSIIAPAYNESECLPSLVESLMENLKPLKRPFEIILVNDGSSDDTEAVIRSLSKTYPEVRGINHNNNYGQSAAIASGLRAAQGGIIATTDADMQNPPLEIPRLLAHLTPGVDAVCGVRTHRRDILIRRLASSIGNGFRNIVTGVPVQDAGCGLRVFYRGLTTELPVFNGLHRFLSTVLKLQGFSLKEVPISHNPRIAGHSKYGINNRLWRGLADCIAMRWYAKRVIPARREESDRA
ncbi:MAG: glycosyltransferase family 2 protein [Verrucomicrobiota bacterium]|nr:glycosyltransferase family 2 protein [Verrucomicrobiota bacterium]MDD8050224.1 glycosyltransferase family 2 protein [Verrucomicrobiota bacterium]